MKRLISFASLLCLLGLFGCNSDQYLELTINYERQPGRGSNQYAVWIEDENGQLIKTLYTTGFTADGGYIPRPACLPTWVNKANPESMTSQQLDAISGPTPQTGEQVYYWDFRNEEGKKVKRGKYKLFAEANFYGDERELWEGYVVLKRSKSEADLPYRSPRTETNKDMITGFTVSGHRGLSPTTH